MQHWSRKIGFVWALVHNDLTTRYVGSFLGRVWLFVGPLINIAIVGIVFQVGLRQAVPGQQGFPWLLAGLLPWYFISDGLVGGASAITEKPWLIKKLVFDVKILPLVRILSAFAVHLVLLTLALIIVLLPSGLVGLHFLQLGYFMFCSIALVTAIALSSSAVCVFARDMANVMALVVQFGFWLTPIFWDPGTKYPWLSKIIMLNPFNYIVVGYRNSLVINDYWFWQAPRELAIFWATTGGLLIIGVFIFARLRPVFADLL
jgi:ABC-type polysaccharide/polyol phosphate export permease